MKWRHFWVTLYISLSAGILAACDLHRDSPFSDELLRNERDLNVRSAESVNGIEADGVIRLAVLTDSHQSYKDLDEVVSRINAEGPFDFVTHLGDFSHHGHTTEFDQFLSYISKLRDPFFVIPGNHDATENGKFLFGRVFGVSNFWVESETYRFIFFNSINIEDPEGFNPTWLLNTVSETSKKIVIFSHVPLKNSARYGGDVAVIFNQILLDPEVNLVVSGHLHRYRRTDENGTVMLVSPPVDGQRWLILEIHGNRLRIQNVRLGEEEWVTLKN